MNAISRAALAAAGLAVALQSIGAARAQVPEAELKAAFIYNFVLFTDWPPSALTADGVLTICAGGSAGSQYDALRQLHGREAAGYRLVVSDGHDGPCQVAVFRAGAGEPLVQPGTLTVCDGPAAACGGAMITLLRERDRVRFDVDAGRIRNGGLVLSSKLLRLARQVR